MDFAELNDILTEMAQKAGYAYYSGPMPDLAVIRASEQPVMWFVPVGGFIVANSAAISGLYNIILLEPQSVGANPDELVNAAMRQEAALLDLVAALRQKNVSISNGNNIPVSPLFREGDAYLQGYMATLQINFTRRVPCDQNPFL